MIYRLANEEVVVDATRNYYNHNLLWVNRNGDVMRREEVPLNIMAGDPFGESPTMIALFAPGPLAMAGAMMIDATQIQRVKGESVSQSLATAVARSAAPALMHLVLSAVLAWLVYRREKSVGQQGVGWAVFVFLLGIPGVIGYLFHRERPARIPCEQCQKPVLRSRGECSSCGEPFPQPRRLGTEVFA